VAGVVLRKGGKYEGWYMDATGKKRRFTGTPNRAQTEKMAQELEAEQRKIALGLVDAADVRRRDAARVPLEDHADAFRDSILDGGGSETYAKGRRSTILRLLKDAGITSIADMPTDAIQSAIGRLKKTRSARTANDALGAIKQFLTWLEDTNRIKEFPRAVNLIRRFPEESDRKLKRRAISMDEIQRLLSAAEQGPPIKLSRRGYQYEERWITGPDRAMLYRLAMFTGFRANEIRNLTPERFNLDGNPPTITCLAGFSKRGKRSGRDDVQPLRREDAAILKPWLATRKPGEPVLDVPEKTAKLLRHDLRAAKIPFEDKLATVDFHALRGTYITHLVRSGINPKIVQKLARHSTITLTLDRYTTLDESDVTEALERTGRIKARVDELRGETKSELS
jgi:integrase